MREAPFTGEGGISFSRRDGPPGGAGADLDGRMGDSKPVGEMIGGERNAEGA